MIRSASELREAMKRTGGYLSWHSGTRKPSAPPEYTLHIAENHRVTVHGGAVNALIKRSELQEISHYWNHGSYRLKL